MSAPKLDAAAAADQRAAEAAAHGQLRPSVAPRAARPAPVGTNTISELATSIQELKSAETTLACLLQGMHGVRTTVELRSDAEVTGMIQSVESDMSISMVDVVIKAPRKRSIHCDAFYVVGKFIRYVHIPTKIHVEKTIEKRIRDTRNAQQKSRHRVSKGPPPP
eukprot:m.182245 g.182245  ORF g.182245 m.182245 type:complete len:164 (-) comp24630_c0_seq2:341-832(-)